MDSYGMYYKDKGIAFDMKNIWFKKEHPFNMSDKAAITGRSIVVLNNVTFRKCILTKSDATCVDLKDSEEFAFKNIMVHEFEEAKTDRGYIAYMNILFYDTSENYSLLVEAEYSKSKVF